MANNLKTVALLAFLGGVFVAIGWLFGGQQGALIALGFAVVINFGMYWFSDKMAIAAKEWGWEFPYLFELQRPKNPHHGEVIVDRLRPYLDARDWVSIDRGTVISFDRRP